MRNYLVTIVCSSMAMGLAGCASTAPSVPRAADRVTNPEGLVKVENSRFDDVWVRPGFNVLSYDSVILSPASITYKTRWPDNELSARQMELMVGYFGEALEATFAENYRIISEPTFRTLRIKADIVDLDINIPTDRPAIRRNRVLTAYSGEMTLTAEVFDARTGELMARVVDREMPGRYWHDVTPVTEWAEVRRAFFFWSAIARRRMDELGEELF